MVTRLVCLILKSQVELDVTSIVTDCRLQQQGTGGQSTASPRRGPIAVGDYGASSPNMGLLMQVPNSPLASPVLPRSPMGGGRSDVSSPNSGRSAGLYSNWQGQRGIESFSYQKPYSFLEELKSGKGRRFELSDITGHVVEFR